MGKRKSLKQPAFASFDKCTKHNKMNEFSYHDIFATKGIEYLIIVVFMFMLIPFWLILNKQVKISRQLQTVLGALTVGILKIPQGLLYSGNHTWMYMEKVGTAKLGLDDLLLHLTGVVKFGFLRKPGEIITKGDLLTEINQNGKVLRIFSPVSGTITETNSGLNETTGMLNEDPYGMGWIYRIKPSNWIAETRNCYFAADATDFSARELERFKDFLARTSKNYSTETAMIIMQDGGEICDHSLSVLPDDVWKGFQEEFLSTAQINLPANYF
jgi:glycine cleavage system H protein